MRARDLAMSALEGGSTTGVSFRQIAIPSEHGGWSFTLEPGLMGLIVAPTATGVALTGAALLAFLLRTPLKLALGDVRRGRYLPRTALATRVAAGYGLLLALLLALATAESDASFWRPLLIALPLFAIEFAYDFRSRSRRLVPEIMGTVGVGSVVAAIVLADGGEPALAYGLWAVTAARAIATVPFVRVQLRGAKKQPVSVAASDAAQALSLGVVVVGATGGAAPAAAVMAIAGLAVFHVVGARRVVPRVGVIGAQQVVLGLTVILITGLAAIAP